MTISIKTVEDQARMRIAGRLTADVLDLLEEHVRPGITTAELDRICHDFIVSEQQAVPAPLNYRGFPKSIDKSVPWMKVKSFGAGSCNSSTPGNRNLWGSRYTKKNDNRQCRLSRNG